MTPSNEPLVSIIIPTYERPAYFREALSSVVHQTYRNLDIFVTDNSHNQETKHVYETAFASDPRITYEHHPEYDAKGNWDRALAYDNPDAAYVNWLMDDDTFYPQKIEQMMEAFLHYPDITLVTSARQLVDAAGRPLPAEAWSRPLVDTTTRIPGREMGSLMLRCMTNFVGEPTTALIKKSAMHEGRLGWTGTEGKYLVSDFPTWLCALSKGDVVYFPKPLSTFRLHEEQSQSNIDTRITCEIGWALALREAMARGLFVIDRWEKQDAITRWLDVVTQEVRKIPFEDYGKQNVRDLFEAMRGMAAALPRGDRLEFSMDTGA